MKKQVISLTVSLLLSLPVFADRFHGRGDHRFDHRPGHQYYAQPPRWWYPGLVLPAFVWGVARPYGHWQCTSFVLAPNGAWQSFYGFGPTQGEAAYNALYACGGPNYQWVGCYIPMGYCGF